MELDGTFHESTIIPGDEMELANSWGVDRIDADQVHGADITGIGVKVAILDSGIDYDHPDLDICYIDGWDFVNGDDDPWDDRGHGTHVAGIVAAKGDGIGVIGVAPGADIYALKVLDDQGVGSFSDIIAALEWCMLNNIDVTNNSYSAKRDPGDLVQQAFNNAAQKGILHIAAAGNHGNRRATRDTIEYPAAYNSVVAVGAVNDMDERASWSGTGSALELSAPGVSIYSTFPGGTYAVYSGTSMA